MGLDMENRSCLNKIVRKKLLLDRLGHPARSGMLGYLVSLLGLIKEKRLTPLQREEQDFTEEVRQQFLKLAEKGISIPVFTL